MNIINNVISNCINFKNNIAIKADKKELTYKNLLNLSLKFASYLKQKKIKKIIIIESIDNNDFSTYISILGCLIASTTFIPVSNSTPKKRIDSIINQSQVKLIVSSNKKKNDFLIKKINLNKNFFKKLKNYSGKFAKDYKKSAYIIFTSGSTGTPKGVKISRESLDVYLKWLKKNFFNEKDIRCSQYLSIGFDVSLVEILGTFVAGGTLFPLKNEFERLYLSKFIFKNKINYWVSVPSATDLLLADENSKKQISTLKKIFFCGELLKKIHLDKLFSMKKELSILNTYGPTESTISCTSLSLDNSNYKKYCKPDVSIGKPIQNISLKITKKKNDKQGELYIYGKQTSAGYLKNRKLNKEKFIKKNNHNIGFKSGDICKIINNFYYFIKRKDRQVKIKGFRVELSEIDRSIENLIQDTSYSIINNQKIYSFIKKKIDLKSLRSKLKKYLPIYMLPSKIIYIKNWPRNASSKIDIEKFKKYI
jgi:D-alanine--poly(phosphoribitol) ligase subunit 1